MADYSYASIQIGGLIPDQAAAKALVGAILFENLCGNEEEARLVLLTAIREDKTASFDDDQKAGGTFSFINDAVRAIAGVCCATSYDASPGYCGGYVGIDANGMEHTASSDGDMPTIPFSALLPAETAPSYEIIALVHKLLKEARLASGHDMPPLSAPLPVLAWLDTGDERGENLDDDGIPCATTAEIAGLISVMDDAGMKPGEHFNVDVDPQASRADDATWVQVWVRVPHKDEGE